MELTLLCAFFITVCCRAFICVANRLLKMRSAVRDLLLWGGGVDAVCASSRLAVLIDMCPPSKPKCRHRTENCRGSKLFAKQVKTRH